MFWRHPTGNADGGNWPKCSATLRGIVGEAKTNQWLHALAIKQPGQNEFVKVDPEGCWMPFEIQRFVLEEVQ